MIKSITEEQIKQAIQAFLTAQYDKKTEKEQKLLTKAIEENDVAKIAELNDFLQPFKDKYDKDTWISYAGEWMSKQLSFGTHISKGIHSSSKGDNLIFDLKDKAVTVDYVGHHTLKNPTIDASGNAAALPLSAFLNSSVIDGVTIGQLVLDKHPALKGVFHSNSQQSDHLQDIFYRMVLSQVKQPKTDERNKQILWANEDAYICLVPLYPVSITNHLYNTIQNLRFSDENTLARKNRNKVNEIQRPYPSLQNLAVVNIGGSNPQGVSQLMSKQGGRNYLLPSLPPKFRQSQDIRISPTAQTIFDSKALQYKAKDRFDALFKLIKTNYNNVNIRDTRKAILDDIVYQVISVAQTIQHSRPAGWSKDYQLAMSQKLWLDPLRAELEGEDAFKQQREESQWREEIQTQFANWLQAIFKQEFKAIAHDFADPEHNEWRSEMEDAIKQSLRLGEGVFA